MAVAPPLLCSPCSIFGQSLWWSRAQLYPTHIELSGWSWTGRTVRRIPLSTIRHVRWWGGKKDVNLELTLEEDALVALYLEESAGTWHYTLRRLRRKNAPGASTNEDPARGAQSTDPPTGAGGNLDRAASGDTLPERTAPHRVGIAPS